MTEKVSRMIKALQDLSAELLCATEEDYIDKIIPYLEQECNDFEWSYDAGISKFVIIIRGEDQVIKVPFHQLFEAEDYDADLSYYNSGEAPEDMEEPKEENYYHSFYEACNIKLINEDDLLEFKGDDYCEVECALYLKADEENLGQYFASETWVADAGDTCIYLQQRVTPFEAQYDNPWRNRTMEQNMATKRHCEKLGVRCFNAVWIEDFFDAYGDQEFQRLGKFLEHYGIYDFHDGNLGYYNGLPILLDYSDFNEW